MSPPPTSRAWPTAWRHRAAALGIWGLVLAGLCGTARADIRIDIDGVEGDLRRNVLAFLSLERYRDRDRLQEDTVVRLYNRIDDEVRSALRPLGYYEPQIHTEWESGSADVDWRIRISITPGQPVMVSEVHVQVHGAGAGDAVFKEIAERPSLRVGAQLNHGLYEQLKGDLQRTAAAYGYLDARLLQNELRVDTSAHTAVIHLEMETGEQYRFGDVRIEQNVIKHELMARFLRFHAGEPYNTLQLLRTQFALDDSQYFSTVEVLPQERDVENRTVPVSITAVKSSRSYSIGAGYGTDTSVRGTLGWTDPLINRSGHRFRAEIKGSAITRSIDSRYDIPVGDPALEKLSFDITGRTEQRSAGLDVTENSFTPSITQVRGRWQRVLSLAFTNTQTRLPDRANTSNLLVPGISYASIPEGFLGETLFSRGLYADLIGSHSALGGDSDFVRLHVQFERVLDLQPRWHLLLRGEVGSSLVRNFDDLPGIYRFFAGGDRSVRGFAYNELSPTETVTVQTPVAGGGTTPEQIVVKTGGRHLLVGSVELARDLPRGLAVATFFDIGNAFNRFGDPMEYSAGVGVRYRLPVVTLGLDLAQPLSESGSPRLHLNISPKL